MKKSWLIVKPEKYETVKGIFKDTKLNITSERHLEVVFATEECSNEHLTKIRNR